MDVRGIDHLAVVTDDMPAAMDFYTRVMRFHLVHVRRVPYEQDRWQPPYDNLRHYFFDMGNDSLFAVFEYPKGLPRQVRDHVGGMQHVAFHVPPEKFDALVAHVKSCGVEVRGPVPLGGRFWSAYFLDPFGTRLELATDRSGVRATALESHGAQARASNSKGIVLPGNRPFEALFLGELPGALWQRGAIGGIAHSHDRGVHHHSRRSRPARRNEGPK